VRTSLRAADDIAQREDERAREAGGAIVTLGHPDYHPSLLDLPQPPPVLYVRGALPPGAALSIVGSRLADRYGLEAATLFAHELAAHGLVIVSGLAAGIDSAAHRAALEASGGRTVAVLGCGVDVEYPRGSSSLANRIAAAGAVISEFPMATRPVKTNFPIRNRLIAALGIGTLVVRAAPRSGSLITARLALDLGRDVYAIPGNILDGRSIGPNTLVRDGALPAQHPREILESLPSWIQEKLEPFDEPANAEAPPPEERLRGVWKTVPRGEAVTVEAISEATGKEVQEVLAQLMELELGGWVRRYPGPCFCRRG
jgi:DNA processing protein